MEKFKTMSIGRSGITLPRKNRQLSPGVTLRATHFQHRDANEWTPTLIYFQPNGAIKDQDCQLWLQTQSIVKGIPCNFVTFDYRSVGDSTGIFERQKTSSSTVPQLSNGSITARESQKRGSIYMECLSGAQTRS